MILALLLAAAWALALPPAENTTPSAEDVLARSIAYHDPSDRWCSGPVRLAIATTYSESLVERRGYATSETTLLFDLPGGRFEYKKKTPDNVIEIRGTPEGFSAMLNGSTEISAGDRDKHRLSVERLPGYRDYYEYLCWIPMKLRDPGTILDPTARWTRFANEDVLELRVGYDPEVGGDTWYFYFDPVTFATVGCRFYHDEEKGDGEYIVFDEEVAAGGVRLPRQRAWYKNEDGAYIATDVIERLEFPGDER